MRKTEKPTKNNINNLWRGDIIKIESHHKEVKPGAIWKRYKYILVEYISNNGSIKGRLYNGAPAWSSYNDNIIAIIKA